jgi:DNA polymerase-4
MAIVRQMAGRVEQISIDEAFLDVSDSPEPSEALARRIQRRIWEELELPCSLGAASNKLVAKIATDFGKGQAEGVGPPNAIWVVPPGEEAAFLFPLPASALWGVGPKTAARLAELGIHTIGDIAARPPEDLARLFGKHGKYLARRARGIDESPVEESHEVKSISREVTFARDLSESRALRATLRELSESVARQLRKSELIGTTVKIKLRWPDFKTITRQASLAQPTDQEAEILATAEELFKSAWLPARRPVRLLGVGVSGLTPAKEPYRQLLLWDTAATLLPVEELRERVGDDSIQRGRTGAGGAKP